MDKFTPGPWAFSRSDQLGDSRFYVAQADSAPYTPNYSDVATLIAETCSGELVTIQEANARLIAAAPDLLKALREATEREFNSFEPDNQSRQYTRWIALIAKATEAA